MYASLATRAIWLLFIFGLMLSSCASYDEPENGVDAGRQFVSATYNGNFKRARQLLSSQNQAQLMELLRIEQKFRGRNSVQKEQLAASPIVIDSIGKRPADAVAIYFRNEYSGKSALLFCEKSEGVWRANLEKSKLLP